MANQNPEDIKIPDKLFFKIGEVSDIAGVPTYVLRFWEAEFKQVKPKRTESGRRQYRKKDIESILRIKHLLYEKKFTIPGAKLYFKNRDQDKKVKSISIREIRNELIKIRDMI